MGTAMIVMFALYMVPGIVTMLRRHRSAAAIVVLNLLLGWTFLGWVAALVWSLTYSGGGDEQSV